MQSRSRLKHAACFTPLWIISTRAGPRPGLLSTYLCLPGRQHWDFGREFALDQCCSSVPGALRLQLLMCWTALFHSQEGDGADLKIITLTKCFVIHLWALLSKNIKYLESFIRNLKSIFLKIQVQVPKWGFSSNFSRSETILNANVILKDFFPHNFNSNKGKLQDWAI